MGDDAQSLDYGTKKTLTDSLGGHGGESCVIQPSLYPLGKCLQLARSPDDFGAEAAELACLKLNPCDHLKGARAASSLYREKILSTGSPV